MGRHSASYIATQQALSAGSPSTGGARYIGRVGGLALALGIGAAVAGGAGFAHADGTTDTKTGPAATDGAPSGASAEGEPSAKTTPRKLGSLTVPKMALGGGALADHVAEASKLPKSIAKIPQQIAERIADRVTAGETSPSSSTGGTSSPISRQRGIRHSVAVGQPAESATNAVAKAPQVRTDTVNDVAATPSTSAQPVTVAPATAQPIARPRLDLPSFTALAAGPATAFAGPVHAAAVPSRSVTTVISSLLVPLGGISSGTGGSPAAPGPVITGALQLLRREMTTPSLAQAFNLSSIGSLLNPTPAPTAPTPPGYPSPTEAVSTPYGTIGKWMLESNGSVSDYGGQTLDNKALLEPVNVIIVDPNSKSAVQSNAKVNTLMILAGFPPQPVHTGGFKGLISGKTYDQQPGGLINAYSNNLFVFQNDHGRLFGPAPLPDNNHNGVADDGYVYSGAFSTESPLTIVNTGLPGHAYISSNMARDALVLRLIATGQVKSVTYVDMDNAVNTGTTTTGDHDGRAVVIVLK